MKGKRWVDHVTVETVETVGKFLERISPEWFLSSRSPTSILWESIPTDKRRMLKIFCAFKLNHGRAQ